MHIRPFNNEMLGQLVTVYNKAVAPVPHCYRVGTHEFQDVVAPVLSGQAGETRRNEALFVAVEEHKLVGFVHAAIGPPKPRKDTTDEGLVRFLWYQPGRRTAGAALLDAAEEHCIERGVSAINVFPQKHRYSFYLLESAYMSDRLGHVAALLGMRGYRRSQGEVYMDWPEFSVAKPAPLPGGLPVEVEHTAGRGRFPGVTVRVQPEDRKIGICTNVSAGEFSRDRLAQDWTFTTWLAVDEEYQGLGLGRWLLQRTLWEAQDIGYRHAAISTAWDNHRSFLFYTNMGYQVADWTYGYRRETP